jgi:hypothetical protein
VCEVAARDDRLRRNALDERRKRSLDGRVLACTRVEIGYMKEPPRHDRMRL